MGGRDRRRRRRAVAEDTGVTRIGGLLVGEFRSDRQRVLPDFGVAFVGPGGRRVFPVVGVEFVVRVGLMDRVLPVVLIAIDRQPVGARGRDRAARIDVLV